MRWQNIKHILSAKSSKELSEIEKQQGVRILHSIIAISLLFLVLLFIFFVDIEFKADNIIYILLLSITILGVFYLLGKVFSYRRFSRFVIIILFLVSFSSFIYYRFVFNPAILKISWISILGLITYIVKEAIYLIKEDRVI